MNFFLFIMFSCREKAELDEIAKFVPDPEKPSERTILTLNATMNIHIWGASAIELFVLPMYTRLLFSSYFFFSIQFFESNVNSLKESQMKLEDLKLQPFKNSKKNIKGNHFL